MIDEETIAILKRPLRDKKSIEQSKEIKQRLSSEADIRHQYERLSELWKTEKTFAYLEKSELDRLYTIVMDLGELILTIQNKTNSMLAEQAIKKILHS